MEVVETKKKTKKQERRLSDGFQIKKKKYTDINICTQTRHNVEIKTNETKKQEKKTKNFIYFSPQIFFFFLSCSHFFFFYCFFPLLLFRPFSAVLHHFSTSFIHFPFFYFSFLGSQVKNAKPVIASNE